MRLLSIFKAALEWHLSINLKLPWHDFSVLNLKLLWHNFWASVKATLMWLWSIKRELIQLNFSALSKHMKGSKEGYLLGQDKTSKFSRGIPFVKLISDDLVLER